MPPPPELWRRSAERSHVVPAAARRIGAMSQPEHRVRLYFLMTSWEWFLVCAGASAAVAMLAGWWPDLSLWPVLGIGLTLLIMGHLCITCGRVVAFPDLVALASSLQWIVGPWLAETYPPRIPVFRMAMPLDAYLEYAVPATALLYVGMYV